MLNDEAHHVWDPDSAWNDAIRFLNETLRKNHGAPLVAQVDFSATPKDNKGQVFKHVIVDTPLGEAVDGGIVKTPIIGGAGKRLEEHPSDNAAYRYDRHLRLGYERIDPLSSEEEGLRGLPSHREALLVSRAIAEEEIDQRLVRHLSVLREMLEVRERILVQPDRDLLLEPLRVGVHPGLREVVSLSHRLHLRS